MPWKLRKRQILPVNQNFSSVYFSLAKFQPVSCNLSLAMIWQMTHTHELPKLCSDTLNTYPMSAVDYTLPWVRVLCMYTTLSARVISVIYFITHTQGFVRTALHAKWSLLNYVKRLTKLNEGSVHNQNRVKESRTRIANLCFMSWTGITEDDVRLLQCFKPQRDWQM